MWSVVGGYTTGFGTPWGDPGVEVGARRTPTAMSGGCCEAGIHPSKAANGGLGREKTHLTPHLCVFEELSVFLGATWAGRTWAGRPLERLRSGATGGLRLPPTSQ